MTTPFVPPSSPVADRDGPRHPTGWDLSRTFVTVSYSLVFFGFLPVALSGEVGVLAPIVFLVAMAASLLRNPHAAPPRPWTARLWTAALLLALAGLVAWSLSDGNWLLHTLQFALLLTVSRFFQRRFAKDTLQLFVLSFLLLLVAAVINPGPWFAICFLAYTVLTMWGLTLLHLVREIEVQTRTGPEHLLPKPKPGRRWLGLRKPGPLPPLDPWPEPATPESVLSWRTRRLVGPRYLAASGLLSLGVLAISALFFFLFPRLGMGFFFAQTRGSQSVIGFGTDAELGQFGALKSSAEVVMRIQFPDEPKRLQQSIRLRGIAFDRFVGNGWQRDVDPSREMRRLGGRYLLPGSGPPEDGRDRVWRADIYLEPLGAKTRVLFAPPQTATVELLDARFDYLKPDRRSVRVEPDGDLTYQARPDTALHYAVEVVEQVDPVAEAQLLRAAGAPLPKNIARRYTGLPEDLDPRIAALAVKLAGNATNRYDQARAIERGLRGGWTYSLAGDQDPDEPLEDFLFGKKSGHCEYFATSMALMLRSLGLAARPVHGFIGGAFNPYGNYRMIRQGDAHAWVEVFFPGIGWRTFDPTPPSGQLAPDDDGLASQVRQIADGASLLWYQWVVEYDLERQLEVLQTVSKLWRGLRGPTAEPAGLDQEEAPDPAAAKADQGAGPWPALAVAAALLAAAGGVWRLRRIRAQTPALQRALNRATARLETALARRRWQRQPCETWGLVAQRVTVHDADAGSDLQRFAEAYDAARYSADAAVQAIATVGQLADATAERLRRLPPTRDPAAVPRVLATLLRNLHNP